MSNYGIICERVKYCLETGWKKFIIFPFGENGMLAKQVLEQAFGIEEVIVADNGLSQYNKNIVNVERLKERAILQDYALIIASVNKEIIEYAHKYIICGKVVDIVSENQSNPTEKLTEIGRYSYGPLAVPNIRVSKVGSFCSFAEGTDVAWNHQLDMVTNHDFIYENVICKEINNQKVSYEDLNKQFVIGNDVWLGKNVILTNGITIGNGVRVGAGAVVTKDLPDYAIAVGVPARVIGYRFTKEQIDKLNKIAWWDWPVEKIKDCYDDFMNIDIFLEKHYKE